MEVNNNVDLTESIFEELDKKVENYMNNVDRQLNKIEQYAHILKLYAREIRPGGIVTDEDDISRIIQKNLILDHEIERIVKICEEKKIYEKVKSIFNKI